jgi:hypothetical protein
MKLIHLAAVCASACAIAGLGLVAKPAAQGASGTWTQKAPLPTARSERYHCGLSGPPRGCRRSWAAGDRAWALPAAAPVMKATAVVNSKIISPARLPPVIKPQAMVTEYDPATANGASWRR